MKAGTIAAVCVLMVLSQVTLSAGKPNYPSNPGITADAYFIAGQGVARFNRTSGDLLWRVLAEEQLFEPVVTGNRVVVGGSSGVFSIDATNGEIRWQRDLDAPAFSPVVHGDLVFVATQDGSLRALVKQSGEERWNRRLGTGWIYPPAVSGELLITGGQDAEIWALEPVTGRPRWHRKLEQEMVYRPVALDGDQVLITTFSGDVMALDSQSGVEQWRTRFPSPSLTASVSSDRVVLPGMDGMLRVLDQTSGKLLWQRAMNGPLAGPVSERNGLLLALTKEGDYFVMTADSGDTLVHRRLAGDPVAGAFVNAESAVIFMTRGKIWPPVPVLVGVKGSNP